MASRAGGRQPGAPAGGDAAAAGGGGGEGRGGGLRYSRVGRMDAVARLAALRVAENQRSAASAAGGGDDALDAAAEAAVAAAAARQRKAAAALRPAVEHTAAGQAATELGVAREQVGTVAASLSAAQIRELHAVFQRLSSEDSSSGVGGAAAAAGQEQQQQQGVTLAQLRTALSHAGVEDAAFVDHAFAVWTADHEVAEGEDARLDWREFLGAMALLAGGGEATPARARAVFQLFDVSGDGFVDRAELEQVLRLAATTTGAEKEGLAALDDAGIEARAAELLAALDTDGDGRISEDEFVAGAEKHGLFDLAPDMHELLTNADVMLRQERGLRDLIDAEFDGDFAEFWSFLTEYVHHHAAFATTPDDVIRALSAEMAQHLPSQRPYFDGSAMGMAAAAPGTAAAAAEPASEPANLGESTDGHQRLAVSMRMSTIAKRMGQRPNAEAVGAAAPWRAPPAKSPGAAAAAELQQQQQQQQKLAGVQMSMSEKHSQLALVQLLHQDGFSAKTLHEFRKLFKQFDVSGSGAVSRADFATTFAQIGIRDPIFVDHLFDLWDTDGSGLIEISEFLLSMCALTATNTSDDEKLGFTFCAIDTDDSGFIDGAELMQALLVANSTKQPSERLSPVEVIALRDEIMEQADADSDGKISREEFFSFARENPLFTALPQVHLLVQAARVSASLDDEVDAHEDGDSAAAAARPPAKTGAAKARGASGLRMSRASRAKLRHAALATVARATSPTLRHADGEGGITESLGLIPSILLSAAVGAVLAAVGFQTRTIINYSSGSR